MAATALADILAGRLAPDVTAQLSPDGAWAVVIESDEVRMSHWIDHATLWQVDPPACRLALGDASWSASDLSWSADSRRLSLTLRVYPGRLPSLALSLELPTLDATVAGLALSAAELMDWLDRYARSSET